MKLLSLYGNIYRAIIEVNISQLLIYRADFYSGMITTLSWTLLSVVAVSVYSYQTSSVAGWTLSELLTLTGVFAIITGLTYSLFLENFISLATSINLGELDMLLVKPVDSQFLATTVRMRLPNLARLVVGVIIVAFEAENIDLSTQSILVFLLVLLAGMVILYSLWLLLVTLNFYARRLDNVISFLLEIFDVVSRTPSDSFKIASSWAFTFLLPMFMVISFPTKALWSKLPLHFALATVVTAGIIFIVSRKFWLYSLRRYSSASS